MRSFCRIFIIATAWLLSNLMFSSTQVQYQEEDTCNDSFRFQSVDFDPNFPKLLTDPKALEEAYGPQDPRFRSESAQIFYINSTVPEKRFIVCLTPKTGSTRFKLLLYKVLHKDFDGVSTHGLDWKAYNPLQFYGEKQVEELLSDHNIPRFQLVRNPYIRAISMYESKLMGTRQYTERYKRGLKYPQDKDMTFDQFVEILFKIYNSPNTNAVGYAYVDKHFQPQNRLCKQHLGMTYNYFLKMKIMNDWFDCFVDKMKIREEVMHGWPGDDNCFFSTKKNPCYGPAHRDGVVVNDFGKFRQRYQSNNNELIRMQKYFQNQTTLWMVSEIFAQDFASYDYPKVDKV